MAGLKRGDVLDVTIEKFADRGRSVVRVNGQVLFIYGGVPGDEVRVRVDRTRKSFAEGRILDLRNPSGLRVEPRCFYFGTCGGCKWQHVSYEAQLDAKRQSVEEMFLHHGPWEQCTVLPTLGSEKEYFYRNKMEFSFSTGRWLTPEEIASGERFEMGFALGLHVPGNYRKVLDLKECHLQSDLSVRIVNGIRELALQKEWSPWDPHSHQGFLRHLVIRQPAHTADLMVNLVTNGYDPSRMGEASDFLRAEFPEVTTFVNTINTGVAQTAFGERTEVLYGSGIIRDRIGRFEFELAPNAFFQTNTLQAERLYQAARDAAELSSDDLVYDLYCGVGTISLFVSDAVRQVVGIEVIPEAVENARANAEKNSVSNCTFVAGDMLRVFRKELIQEHGVPDVLIVDPPRAGMHPRVVEEIGKLRPERFVYVSCNPATQVRDLAMLNEVYEIVSVQPVDLFPQTHHVESVANLRLRNT